MKSAICAIARHENDYLLEWLTYHLNIGFDTIFLYDNNDSEDDSVSILIYNNHLQDKVKIIDYRNKKAAQLNAYNSCYSNFGKEVDWIAFTDIDEFVTLNPNSGFQTINAYLEEVNNFDVIFINWMFYGDNDLIHKEAKGLIARFPKAIPLDSPINQHIKSIARTGLDLKFIRNPHCPDGNFRICDDCQKELLENGPFKKPSYNKLYIRHYATKTIEEYIQNKILRGAADSIHNPYKLDLFYEYNKRTKEKENIEKCLLPQFHRISDKERIKVSVIVPNYNHKKYLQERIDSIINQTFTDFELIILDDCSIDRSQELLLSYQNIPQVSHIILNPQNSGSPFLQWEKGIKMAKGDYIWIAESDDYADPHFLEHTVQAMNAQPEVSVCLTGSYLIDNQGNHIMKNYDLWDDTSEICLFKSREYLLHKMLSFNSVYNASMVLFKNDGCLSNISQAYKTMHYCGDWLFWIEQIRKGNVIEIRKKLNYFRQHEDSTTKKSVKNRDSIEEMAFIKNYFYQNIPINWKDKAIDKATFYRIVKHYPVSQNRKRELYKIIAKEAHITAFSYFIGKRVQSYVKYFKKGKGNSI